MVMPSTLMHMKAMLPEGVDCKAQVLAYRPGRRGNGWPNVTYTRDDLAQVAAVVASDPRDIYVRTTLMAPTVHLEPWQRGGTGDTGGIVAFFADLDVAGPNHKASPSGLPHPTDRQVLDLLGSVPAPSLTIATGGGYHAWWYLTEPIPVTDVTEAETLTKRWCAALIELGRRQGFHVDDVGDLARVGRLCGTVNGKRGGSSRVHLVDARVWPDPDHDPYRYRLEELADVFAIAPPPTPAPAPRRITDRIGNASGSAREGLTPADAAACLAWSDILEPHGWRLTGHSTIGGRSWELWLRPGDPTSDYSLKADPDGPCIVWSSAAGLPAGPGQKLTKFRVLAHLEHRGDETAAGRAIRNAARIGAR